MRNWVVLWFAPAVAGAAAWELLATLGGETFRLTGVAGLTVLLLLILAGMDLHDRIKGTLTEALAFGLGLAAVVVLIDVLRGDALVPLEIALIAIAGVVFSLLLSGGERRLERWAREHELKTGQEEA